MDLGASHEDDVRGADDCEGAWVPKGVAPGDHPRKLRPTVALRAVIVPVRGNRDFG